MVMTNIRAIYQPCVAAAILEVIRQLPEPPKDRQDANISGQYADNGYLGWHRQREPT